MKVYGGSDIQLHLFLTSALIQRSDQPPHLGKQTLVTFQWRGQMALQRVRTFCTREYHVPPPGTEQGMFGLQVRSVITTLTELTLLRKT
jgi:hypothetical protein